MTRRDEIEKGLSLPKSGSDMSDYIGHEFGFATPKPETDAAKRYVIAWHSDLTGLDSQGFVTFTLEEAKVVCKSLDRPGFRHYPKEVPAKEDTP